MAESRKSTRVRGMAHARGHSSRKKQKTAGMLPLIVLLILIITSLSWYFFRASSPSPVLAPGENVTPKVIGVQELDMVSIEYVLTLTDGTVVDTNNGTLARKYNLSTYVNGPFRFVVGQSSKLKGFDKAIVGMTLGQVRTKLIPASETVLIITKNLMRRVVRNQPFPRFRYIPEQKFIKAFNKKPIIGDIVVHEDQPFSFKVLDVINGTVRIEPNVQEHQRIRLPGYEWESEVLVKTHNDIVLLHHPTPGQIITTEFGPARVDPQPGILNITYLVNLGQELTYNVPSQDQSTMPYQFRVTNLTNQSFTLTRIDYLPQENLVLTARLLEWIPDVKKNKYKLIDKENVN